MDNKDRPRTVLGKRSRRMRMDRSANDRISQLPNELLLIILSFLTVKDAIMTSMVSRKWRNLWMDVTGCLNLEIPGKTKVMMIRHYSHTEAVKHTDMVNVALDLHRGPYLDELRIGAYRDTCVPIHRWINFALQKGVKILELNFNSTSLYPGARYGFPSIESFANLLDDKTFEGRLHHPCRVSPEKHQFRSFCCLKSLSLGFFDVCEEIIYYFLSNCMFLEHLRVEGSDTLLNLEVADGLQLKCLEIIRCVNISSLKIYAKNLVSLVYIGPKIDVPFQDVPLNCLELTIGDRYGESFIFQHNKHKFYLSQLERLKFKVPNKVHAFLCCVPHMFPEMVNLRHLELHVPIGTGLLGYTTFFVASPFMSTFKMEYRLRRSIPVTEAARAKQEQIDKRHEERKVSHQHLQKVELIGFHDAPTDVHFAMHLISMAVCLKKMVLNFRQHSGTHKAFRNVEKKLRDMLPAGAELVLQKT